MCGQQLQGRPQAGAQRALPVRGDVAQGRGGGGAAGADLRSNKQGGGGGGGGYKACSFISKKTFTKLCA